MAAKRPERRDTGEWAKHLRPKRKRAAWKADRRANRVTHYVGDGCCDFCGGHGQNCATCDNKGRDE